MRSTSEFPGDPEVLARAQAGDRVLDSGCDIGQDLPLLAADGASPRNMYVSDISWELWDMDFELFNNRGKMMVKFIQDNNFGAGSGLGQLQVMIDVVIAIQFMYLSDWERQVLVIKRNVEPSKPGTVLVGYQLARERDRDTMGEPAFS